MAAYRPSAVLVHTSVTLSLITFLFSFAGHHIIAMAIPAGMAFATTLVYHFTSCLTRKGPVVIGTMTNNQFVPLLDLNTPSFYFRIILLIIAVLLWLATFIVCTILNARHVRYPIVVANIFSGTEGILLLLFLVKSIIERKKEQRPVVLDEDSQGVLFEEQSSA